MNIPLSWRTLMTSANKQTVSNILPTILQTEPLELRASNNILPFTFLNQLTNLSPRKAKLTIRVNSMIANGAKLVISSDLGFDVTLFASTAPTYNEFFTSSLPYSVSLANTIASSISEELSNNIQFNSFYSVYALGTDIVIESLIEDEKYNIDITTTPTGLLKLIPQSYNAINKLITNNYIDYALFVDVYSVNEVYGKPFDKTDNSVVNYAGRLLFNVNDNNDNSNDSLILTNVSGIVNDYVDIALPKTSTIGQTLTLDLIDLDNIDRSLLPINNQYFLIYGDSYRFVNNGDRKYFTQGMSSVLSVQNASFEHLQAYNLQRFVWNYDNSNTFEFLSDCPNKELYNWTIENNGYNAKEVNLDSIEFIQFIQKFNEIGSITNKAWIDLVCYFNDGSSQQYDRYFTNYTASSGLYIPMNKGGNVSIDVSPNALGIGQIQSITGKMVEYYTVRFVWTVNDSTRHYSEYKGYRMNNICYDNIDTLFNNQLNIVWFNNLGGWDTQLFLGDKSVAVDRKEENISLTIPFNANTTQVTNYELEKTINLEVTTKYTAKTKQLYRSQYQWLKSIAKSPSIFAYDPITGYLKSIKISKFDYSYNDYDDSGSMSIEYYYYNKENVTSR